MVSSDQECVRADATASPDGTPIPTRNSTNRSSSITKELDDDAEAESGSTSSCGGNSNDGSEDSAYDDVSAEEDFDEAMYDVESCAENGILKHLRAQAPDIHRNED